MNFTWIKAKITYRNGEQTANLCVREGEDCKDVATEWAESTGCGQQYGYELEWETITNKDIIVEEIYSLIFKNRKEISDIENEISKLTSDVLSL